MRSVHDPLAVGGKKGAAVVAQLVGQALHSAAVGVHGVNVQVSVAHRREDDPLAIVGKRRLGVVPGALGELLEDLAPLGRIENLV